jgi:precorrin-8X/cobalt-precorrin-8 methylmutase
MNPIDHPIFAESVARIRGWLGDTGLEGVRQEVLERLVHSAGDLRLAPDLRFSPDACERGMAALASGATVLTDTAMAAAAVAPMARRTFGNPVRCLLDWAPPQAPAAETRSAAAMARAWPQARGAVVLIGSAPTALEKLLDLVAAGAAPPALVIGMPVGFVGVKASKRRLAGSGLPHILLQGTRGGAGLAAATANALLRRAWLDQTG